MATVAAGKLAMVQIGTSNIVLPGTKKTFPAAFQSGSRLTYYASLFSTLEINSSFYKVPMPGTFEKWSAEVPDSFRFSVKLWRNITHAKGLAFNTADVDFFMDSANRITDKKKGCLLIQFPASITVAHMDRVSAILERVNTTDPRHNWRKCVEFRHTSWYTDDAYTMLDRYHASLVLHDMPASAVAALKTKAAFVYLRFHGINGDYKGSYPAQALDKYAANIRSWLKQGKEVYAYFNNTIGDAFDNAQSLKKMLRQR